MNFCQGTEYGICICARAMRPGPRNRFDLFFILAARLDRLGHLFLHNLMYHQSMVPSQIDQLFAAYRDFCRYYFRPFDFVPTVRQAQYELFLVNNYLEETLNGVLFQAYTEPDALIRMLQTSENW
ncbi:hypothetical protein CAEBREN_16901 [Caenorhabditis brenneri]|uniref:Uncharacterized protein n=1 Tax=Caenorhabditis brenneri TaxID=135651 RepID=G0MQS1_CAEBE|nr:hypothetical protein CAEBREN_16901 [Caenorhabditis brenneri]